MLQEAQTVRANFCTLKLLLLACLHCFTCIVLSEYMVALLVSIVVIAFYFWPHGRGRGGPEFVHDRL